ncbi:hypothetical protein [Laspinema olomoucense]|uniref:Uncharacterized protein n=1 Tax=Laspinema olomoucense D3b TaxID=2953688 RepID=A0ABT2N7T7_9CYAN|nr:MULTISPECIES: hypothetical protein [unclassified Laspinema]MCT7973213.1 hypothetical protein [Laspinema sp. D3d]MCT7978757.1 hypothetical protein [Laspinema sp. D3b]MCT7993234.1 hypothetical protein [Laspinema sp. D3c]
MRQLLLKVSIGMLVLILSACGGEPETPEVVAPVEPPPTATGTPPEPPEAAEPTKSPEFEKPVVPQRPDPTSIGNLIPPTSPDERVRKLEQEKARQGPENPFGILDVQPVPVTPTAGAAVAIPRVPEFPSRAVPDLPELPVAIGPQLPPRQAVAQAQPFQPFPGPGGGTGNATGPGARPGPGGGTGNATGPGARPGRPGPSGPQIPALVGQGVPSLPELPVGIGPEQLPPRPKPPVQQAAAGPPAPPQPPKLPPLVARGVPNLPELPVGIGPEQLPPVVAQAPAGPPTPPSLPPLVARGVPGLPDLPVQIGPEQLPPPPPPPVLPPPPSTDLAQGTEVTGVIRAGGQVQIIVKAPNEATSRYVKVGDRIALGEVLVKEVQNLDSADPIVILEQNGIEVSKALGEQEPPEATPGGVNLANAALRR